MSGTAYKGPTPPGAGAGGDGGNRERLPPGTKLNNTYEIVGPARGGKGGMGVVYEARELRSTRRAAIKVIKSEILDDSESADLFENEAGLLAQVHHEAIVGYRNYAHDPDRDVSYLAMEFVDGRSLEDWLGDGKISAQEGRRLLRRLASGMSAAHRVGAFHRDLAPDNILAPFLPGEVPPDGGIDLEKAKIIDFGIGLNAESGGAADHDSFRGKLQFAAPEQFNELKGRIDAWTDVYSLGLVIAAAVMGKPIDMAGANYDEAVRRRRTLPDLSGVDASLRPTLTKMLKPRAEDRLQSMAAVIADLDATEGRKENGAKQLWSGLVDSIVHLPRPWLIGGGVAVACLLALAVGLPLWVISQNSAIDAPPPPADMQVTVTGPPVTALPPPAPVTGGAVVRGLPQADLDTLSPDQRTAYANLLGALRGIDCAWLRVRSGNGGLVLEGGARDPAQVRQAASTAGATAGDVVAVNDQICATIEALRPGAATADDPVDITPVHGASPGLSFSHLGQSQAYLFVQEGQDGVYPTLSLTSPINAEIRKAAIANNVLSGNALSGYTLAFKGSVKDTSAYILILTPQADASFETPFASLSEENQLPLQPKDLAAKLNGMSGWTAVIDFVTPASASAGSPAR